MCNSFPHIIQPVNEMEILTVWVWCCRKQFFLRVLKENELAVFKYVAKHMWWVTYKMTQETNQDIFSIAGSHAFRPKFMLNQGGGTFLVWLFRRNLNPTQVYQNVAEKNPVHSTFPCGEGHGGRNFTRTTGIILSTAFFPEVEVMMAEISQGKLAPADFHLSICLGPK